MAEILKGGQYSEDNDVNPLDRKKYVVADEGDLAIHNAAERIVGILGLLEGIVGTKEEDEAMSQREKDFFKGMSEEDIRVYKNNASGMFDGSLYDY